MKILRRKGSGYYVEFCEADELFQIICDRIADVVVLNSESDQFVIPVSPSFCYSDEGILLFTIGHFCIICEKNPPEKEKLKEIISDAYWIITKIITKLSKISTQIEKIEEFPLGYDQGYNLRVQINS